MDNGIFELAISPVLLRWSSVNTLFSLRLKIPSLASLFNRLLFLFLLTFAFALCFCSWLTPAALAQKQEQLRCCARALLQSKAKVKNKNQSTYLFPFWEAARAPIQFLFT
jgi:hypothetical protein